MMEVEFPNSRSSIVVTYMTVPICSRKKSVNILRLDMMQPYWLLHLSIKMDSGTSELFIIPSFALSPVDILLHYVGLVDYYRAFSPCLQTKVPT